MNESEYQALLEKTWRGPLDPEEQARLDAWLATRPQARAEWESENALNRCIGQLPDAPLPSNFTARVLRALDKESAEAARRASVSDWLRRWFRRPVVRIAWAVLLLSAALIAYYEHQASTRNEVAKGLSVLAEVATLSDPVALQDFEAIERLSQAAPNDDDELFAVLNQ